MVAVGDAFQDRTQGYETAKKSEYVMAPGLDNWNLQSEAPVKPDENGSYIYTVAKPGRTKEF
ncbi:hypothetical protein FACS189454_03630 [Planctomycetales bacterium]|nr:hypothetical protein FACS189454_03630 [Planctomycetales bacterium]